MENVNQSNQQVQQVLKYTYSLVPIVAGLDKFTNRLTNWNDYLSESVTNMLPFSAVTFLSVVGIMEIAAGLLVLLRPKIGAWVVMTWLILIAFILALSGRYFDVAVRDLVMAVGAFALRKLLEVFTHKKLTQRAITC
jgi:uncharacterized membrane protein YphA (DoxX/SURF4 family)